MGSLPVASPVGHQNLQLLHCMFLFSNVIDLLHGSHPPRYSAAAEASGLAAALMPRCVFQSFALGRLSQPNASLLGP
jgi:hypothetical protein